MRIKQAHFCAIALLIGLSMSANNLQAQYSDSLHIKPKLIPTWTYFVPGASYFYQGKITQGAIFSAIELGGIFAGIKYDKQLQNETSTPYYNYPLWIGLQAFQTEKLTIFKSQLEYIKYHNPDFRYDEMTDQELYLAPFKPKNIFTPITGGMVLLAAAFVGLEKMNETESINQVEKMYFINKYIPRNEGLAAFGSVSMAMSWGAGIGEEYVMRNYMMPLLDYRFGQRKGLVISSVLFGSAHLTNLFFVENPDYASALLQVAEASVAGYFLGRDVQRRGYDIGPAVAAHTWYDFTLMLGSFLVNPRNNFLGVNMKFKL